MSDKKRLIVEAAILATKGLDQEQIAEALRVTQGTVSRRLKAARDLGYIHYPPPQLQISSIEPDLLRSAEYSVRSGHLRDRLVSRLNALVGTNLICDMKIERSHIRSREKRNWASRLKIVCQAAASAASELVYRASAVGVAWGRTLRLLIDEMKSGDIKTATSKPVTFPIVGTFPNSDRDNPYPISLTSTRLASDLAEIINGKVPDNQVSLEAVPAYIPKEFNDIRDALTRFYSTLPGFREVFGGPEWLQHPEKYPAALMNTFDMLITGMGDMPSKDGGSPSLKERLRIEGARHEDWSRITVGDISGVLLPRPGATDAQLEIVSEINRRFIGIGLRDLQVISRRCIESHGERPGVMAIAHDRSKARTVLEAVRNRCVNRLFVDEDLAAELDRLTSPD